MLIPHGATVIVADGETVRVLSNTGSESHIQLTEHEQPTLGPGSTGSGVRHRSSAANPSESRLEEDSFAAAVATWVNREVLEGRIGQLVVVATPKTLGELRLHYHKALKANLLGEISKDLASRPVRDIEAALHQK